MPSYRYTKDIKPEDNRPEPPKEYTKKEKAANWWHYHKLWVIAGVLVLALIFYFTWEVLSRTKPDFTMGIVSPEQLPEPLTEKLAAELDALVPDLNGDGKQATQVHNYAIRLLDDDEEDDMPSDPYVQIAGITQLTGALSAGDPVVFVSSPDYAGRYQQSYALFGNQDGSMPAEDQDPLTLTVAWKDCPTLASLDLTFETIAGETMDGQALLAEYRVGIRAYYDSALEKDKNGLAQWQAAHDILEQLTS